jgi:hypothetical protein
MTISARDLPEYHMLCRHEASHAVAATVFGRQVHSIQVGYGVNQNIPHRICARCLFSEKRREPWPITVIGMMGPVSDHFWYGRDIDPCTDDYKEAIKSAREIAPDRVDEVITQARRAAEHLVAFHRRAIELLADRVADADGRMGGTEIGYLLKGWHVRSRVAPKWVLRGGSRPGSEMLERHDGRTVATPKPDPLRRDTSFERRIDGFVV